MKNLAALVISVFTFSSVSSAVIINVPTDQATIQAGIGAAANGDTVLVQPGTYVENINFNGKNIVVGSLILTTTDISYASQTIIDGNQDGSVVTLESGENATAAIVGFTITNGYNTGGGGIMCQGSDPCIQHNIITNNQAYQGGGIKLSCSKSLIEHNRIISNSNWAGQISAGGGIYIWESDLIVSDNQFVNNISARHGGAIHLERSSAYITNNIISGNSGGDVGGGICCYVASSGNIINNLISGNDAHAGGGIYLNEVPFHITNNTICFNSATDGAGLMCINHAEISVVNTILWENVAHSNGNQAYLASCQADFHFCDIQEGTDGFYISGDVVHSEKNNIVSNPMFINSGKHPFSLSSDSDCINAGQPDTTGLHLSDHDLANNPRITGSVIDIGAYEWQGTASVWEAAQLNQGLFLSPNYPNPFNPHTSFTYNLPKQSIVSLVVYDLLGRRVKQLIDRTQEAGLKTVHWDATDDHGQPVGVIRSVKVANHLSLCNIRRKVM